MSLLDLYRKIEGKGVSTIGTVLGLPEMGISEKITGSQAPTQTITNTNDYNPYFDPANYAQDSTNTTSGGTYTSGTTPSYNADDARYLDDQIGKLQRMLQSAQTGLTSGLTGLEDSYNKEVSSANQDRSRALEDFGTQRQTTQKGKDTAVGTVNTNARTLADSVRRILGMASGSGSSAYQLAAPNAVARSASQRRQSVMDKYGQNEMGIKTAEDRAVIDFQSLLDDLAEQKKQREEELRAGVLEKEQSINESMANVAGEKAKLLGGGYGDVRVAQQPYESAINDRQTQLDNLFAKFRTPYSVKAVNVQTPTLQDYTVDRAGINANGSTVQDSYSNFLKKKLQEQYV